MGGGTRSRLTNKVKEEVELRSQQVTEGHGGGRGPEVEPKKTHIRQSYQIAII